MSEQQDKHDKTEEPTRKKLDDAVRKGNTPVSREAPVFASMIGILLILSFGAEATVPAMTATLGRLLDGAGAYALASPEDAVVLVTDVAVAGAIFIAPMAALLVVVGLAAAFLQTPPRLVGERIRPQASRVSPKAGLQRIFGSHGLMEFLRSLFKFAAVGLVCFLLLRGETARMVEAIHTDPALLPTEMLRVATRLVAVVCVATILLVAADIVWSRFKWRKDLRMSRRELKDEMKQAEGDPLMRARMRSLAQDRSRRRMLGSAERATVVIANPTHYAVALRYLQEEGGAPLVVAKGRDLVALRIRGIAREHGIPIVEDKALARALYEAVQVDRWIPPEFYRAVAEILFYLHRRGDAREATPRGGNLVS